jgi:predicted nucleotidyltransferase component of viral defense system
MDLREVRSSVISALFSDEFLFNTLVLKGGNALDIVYRISSRSSVDIDLSIEEDFTDLDSVSDRILECLKSKFDSLGYVVFDFEFVKKPSTPRIGRELTWGGYQINFKLISKSKFEKNENNIEVLRRTADTIGPAQKRNFKIDISKFEFCETKIEAELNHQPIYVYSLPMIAIEKLRAICQQMPSYKHGSHSRGRARDFLDIHTVVNSGLARIATAENVGLLLRIFAAKEVPVELLDEIADFREFHRPDWDAVVQTTSEQLEEFDFYFDSVLDLVRALKAVWVE